MRTLWRRTATFLEMIKISHTIFALPFAVGASFLAERQAPAPVVIAKIVLAVFFARTAAMSFNRLVDRDLDAVNPRTAARALPSRVLSPGFVTAATLLSIAGFVATCAWINRPALLLSPVALAIVLGYSFTKRFTALCHVVLGASLALAPIGAWLAVTGSFTWEPWLLGGAVLLWVTGFDILYACMDVGHDRQVGLHSVPARLGIPGALRLAAVIHLSMVGALLALWYFGSLGAVFLSTVLLVLGLLAYEHRLVRPDDLSQVQRAFLTMNGVISALLMTAMILEAVVR